MRIALLLCLRAAATAAQDLLAQPDLSPGVASTPRLPEATEAAARINARLAELDAEALENTRDMASCDPWPHNEYTRGVYTTLATPTLISFSIREGSYCASAAHPWSATWSIIMSRVTGEDIDPFTWLPPALSPGIEPASDPWDSATKLARLAPLTELYIATELAPANDPPDPACHDLLRGFPHGFDLRPDSSANGLVVIPTGLSYVDTPCVNPVTVPLATLRSLGFSSTLLSALSATD